jgi:hypothetical protein
MEKRRFPRYDTENLSYVCFDEDGNVVYEGMGKTLNVSEVGILLETAFRAAPNHTLALTIAMGDDLFDVHAKAVYTKTVEPEIFHIGVEFLEMDDQSKEVLNRYITFFEQTMGENV